jgi:flavin reductase (DIM6/NTAB) family NADH-FMN oxidoreductase RutF
MPRIPAKADFPVADVRRYLEPGPVVLVTSRWQGRASIMTMAWHTVMDFSPALLGCCIARSNYSFELVRGSRECVVNLPTAAMVDTVVGIGSCCGREVDKFEKFGLTAVPASVVAAPLIGECHASFECRLADDALVEKYDFFIFEVVKAHVAPRPKHPETLHYTGDGVFMLAGRTISRRAKFRPECL